MISKNKLNEIMANRNLSYRQLERMTGVSHTMLNKICNGETVPTQTTMILIAKGLRLKVTDIFDLDYYFAWRIIWKRKVFLN